jgi:hypothetical protein
MPHGAAEVHQARFRQQGHSLAAGDFDFVDLRLDIVSLQVLQVPDLDPVVEAADVANGGAVLHHGHLRLADVARPP